MKILGVVLPLLLISCSVSDVKDPENIKAAWYEDAFEQLTEVYDNISLAITWHERWQNEDESWSDLRINSSPEALAAYRAEITNAYLLGKDGLQLPLPGEPIQPPVTGCYLGVYPDYGETEDDVNRATLDGFEELSGKSVCFSPFSAYFGEDTVAEESLEEIAAYGAVPMLRLMPWGAPYYEGDDQERYSFERILAGDFDTYLTNWAEAVKDFGEPTMVTFALEQNGNWFPWSGIKQGGAITDGYGDASKADGPERFIDAWRYVYDIFEAAGVENATWYFQVNSLSYPDEDWNRLEAYYPGDDYTDWVGMSAYGALYADDDLLSFSQSVDEAYQKFSNLCPGKPLMLAEWGVMER